MKMQSYGSNRFRWRAYTSGGNPVYAGLGNGSVGDPRGRSGTRVTISVRVDVPNIPPLEAADFVPTYGAEASNVSSSVRYLRLLRYAGGVSDDRVMLAIDGIDVLGGTAFGAPSPSAVSGHTVDVIVYRNTSGLIIEGGTLWSAIGAQLPLAFLASNPSSVSGSMYTADGRIGQIIGFDSSGVDALVLKIVNNSATESVQSGTLLFAISGYEIAHTAVPLLGVRRLDGCSCC